MQAGEHGENQLFARKPVARDQSLDPKAEREALSSDQYATPGACFVFPMSYSSEQAQSWGVSSWAHLLFGAQRHLSPHQSASYSLSLNKRGFTQGWLYPKVPLKLFFSMATERIEYRASPRSPGLYQLLKKCGINNNLVFFLNPKAWHSRFFSKCCDRVFWFHKTLQNIKIWTSKESI